MSDTDQHIEALDSVPDSAQVGAPSPNGNGNGRAVVGEVASSKGRRTVRTPRIAAVADVPQEDLPDQMNEADLPYHLQVVQDFNAAQAVMQSWMRFCAMRYRLRQGDRITESGKIVREGAPDAVAAAPQP